MSDFKLKNATLEFVAAYMNKKKHHLNHRYVG